MICCFYLIVVIGTVHSATYYYRAGREGREIVAPAVDEVQKVLEPLIAELKKDPLVLVDESVKSVPVAVAAVVKEEAAPVKIVADEARLSEVPVEKLESLEIDLPAGSALKAATISETVKEAAIEAIRTINAENSEVVPSVPVSEPKPVEAAVVKVENVEPELKLKTVESVPVSEIVVPVEEKVVEEAVSALVNQVVPEVKEAPKDNVAEPVLRQEPSPAAPTSPWNAFVNSVQQPLANIIAPIQNLIRPNAIVPASAGAAAPTVESVTVANSGTTAASGPAAFLQQVSNTLNNILRPSAATVPAAPAPAVQAASVAAVNEIKGGELSVQQIGVNEKVDLAKSAEKIE